MHAALITPDATAQRLRLPDVGDEQHQAIAEHVGRPMLREDLIHHAEHAAESVRALHGQPASRLLDVVAAFNA